MSSWICQPGGRLVGRLPGNPPGSQSQGLRRQHGEGEPRWDSPRALTNGMCALDLPFWAILGQQQCVRADAIGRPFSVVFEVSGTKLISCCPSQGGIQAAPKLGRGFHPFPRRIPHFLGLTPVCWFLPLLWAVLGTFTLLVVGGSRQSALEEPGGPPAQPSSPRTSCLLSSSPVGAMRMVPVCSSKKPAGRARLAGISGPELNSRLPQPRRALPAEGCRTAPRRQTDRLRGRQGPRGERILFLYLLSRVCTTKSALHSTSIKD